MSLMSGDGVSLMANNELMVKSQEWSNNLIMFYTLPNLHPYRVEVFNQRVSWLVNEF